ncbi:uncharacterized protein LODBEIA_P37020 [Lodderomyces beijingensis]|uniref:Condensin complex subunit 1 n=1 Tax=Lodderomyces beijingensis TaxID=1775926 RepID=A0ABP0ZMV9_9ASCO
MDFNLQSYFNEFDVDREYSLDYDDLPAKIESIVDALAHNPQYITTDADRFEEIVEITHAYKGLDSKQQKTWSYLITSSLNNLAQIYSEILAGEDYQEEEELAGQFKTVMERFGYLGYVLLKHYGSEDFSPIGEARSQKSVPRELLAKWKTNCANVEAALTAAKVIMTLDLGKMFITTPERDAFVELFSRPIVNMMESPERMKILGIRLLMFEVLAYAVTKHHHGTIMQHSLIQYITFYPHLPPYIAAFLNTLSSKHQHTHLTESVLREIAQTRFNPNDTNGPKALSEFLVKLSELDPMQVLKQMTSVIQLLANTNYQLRCAVMEACGNVAVELLKRIDRSLTNEDDDIHNTETQAARILNLLSERVLDQSSFVRAKAIQALTRVAELKLKLSERRGKMIIVAVKSLSDKSTLVRRNAIKLLGKLVLNHPFQGNHGTHLARRYWRAQLKEAEEALLSCMPQPLIDTSPTLDAGGDGKSRKTSDASNEASDSESESGSNSDVSMQDAEENNNEADVATTTNEHESDESAPGNSNTSANLKVLPDTTQMARAKLKFVFYKAAVEFIDAVEEGTYLVCKLLLSRNRNEAIDSMDYLVLADAYEIENASDGIKKMLHLIWTKGTSEEGKSVSAHLIDCYKNLFLLTPEGSRAEKSAHIAKNLMNLTVQASLSDLVSLEKLLCTMYSMHMINADVVTVLWQIYKIDAGDTEEVIGKRRAAIIILGMLGNEDPRVVTQGIESILNIGLGDSGERDCILCRYSCIALQKTSGKWTNNPVSSSDKEEAVRKLQHVLTKYSDDAEWFAAAEQAIHALFCISPNPVDACTKVLKIKTNSVFKSPDANEKRSSGLSQLLFLVGHIAIKTIVFLETLEAQFKKKKQAAEASGKANARAEEDDAAQGNELEMIGGTSEDDFADAVSHVREKELLYGEKALLAGFGAMVRQICSSPKKYRNATLQRHACLCLVKLMCVSSIYCEENLPLLLSIMESSADPVIRCNCVLGLGDLAISFNRLIDENTDYIYRRLTDENIMVQRTCLMTVTFLILAGQVKVKGQLSSMAKCLEHPDQNISDMCRLFFTELAAKDNAIYNGFIDIFSGLSFDESLGHDAFKRILKFLIGFVDKERHQKQLCEKLMVRLSKARDEKEWKDVAFALETFPFTNDDITEAIKQGYRMVSSKE